MDAAFTSIAFSEPETAETNLSLLEQRLPAALWPTLPALLTQLPDPDGSLNYLERYLRDAPGHVVAYLGKNPAALHYLLLVFSYSHFLSETMLQRPELITWLHRRGPGEGLDTIKSREDLLEEFARFAATEYDQPPTVVLARFKRREYLRITIRDVLGLATLADTTLELSNLSDVLLERALRSCEQKLDNDYGTPQTSDANDRVQSVRMIVVSLGKLGGQELNYASDIDLMFLYEHDGQTAGGAAGSISNAEYFVKLSQGVLKTVTDVTPEGALFRVDMRLRPEGQQGDLAISIPAALQYYRSRAREWELQMLIRARVSAGDFAAGGRFLKELQPLIYRPEFDLAVAQAVLDAREGISRELRRQPGLRGEREATSNVKLSPGGIRDIEFLTQCLQRLYGGKDNWLAGRGAGSTLVTLQRLHDKGYINGRDFFRLATAYQFFRKVEHRLQLRQGLQRHTLPDSAGGLDRLARRSGVEPAVGRTAGEQLLARIAQHFSEVREIYERVLLIQFRDGGVTASPERGGQKDLAPGPLGPRLQSEYPGVARVLAEARSTQDSHARRGLHHYLTTALLDPEFMSRLEAKPELIARAGAFFARSDLAVEALCRNPEDIAIVEDPDSVVSESVPAAASVPESFDAAMAALRIEHRKCVLAALVRALLGMEFDAGPTQPGVAVQRAQPFETFAAITRCAEIAIQGALRLAMADPASPDARLNSGGAPAVESAPFAIIALGRLGTGEMDIASDADMIFVTEEGLSGEETAAWARLAERFVNAVSSHTREGILFPVDTRLRPRGADGEIIQSSSYLRKYFESEAQAWEAATFLKARPLAGNRALATRSIEQVQGILLQRFGSERPGETAATSSRELAEQLAHTRDRVEREGAAHGTGSFKHAAGGYYDVEYILAYLTLARGLLPRAAEGPGHVLRQIAAIESAGALDPARAQTLRAAALLYRSLDHALRLVTGAATSQMPEPALAERVTPLLAEWKVPIGASLESAVLSSRREIRKLYEQIILKANH
jgi:glutamate-ammonia-ligase adenylyltransferase